MQNKIRATYQNGVFVPILNGENLDLQEDTTVEITLEKIEEKETKQSVVNGSSESKRQKQSEWIKANREKYGGHMSHSMEINYLARAKITAKRMKRLEVQVSKMPL